MVTRGETLVVSGNVEDKRSVGGNLCNVWLVKFPTTILAKIIVDSARALNFERVFCKLTENHWVPPLSPISNVDHDDN